MKGKKILTLVSAAMGLAIVGSTFAAWAVTDNADPFGIKVSPGQVGPDTTQFVTLSYGTSTFANVNNLEAGKARLAGSVLLKADTNDGTTFPHAVFDIELEDRSNAKAAGEAKLVDLLQVDVYTVAITEDAQGVAVIPDGATPIGTIPTEGGEKEASIAVTIPSGTGLSVWVVVSLDADTDAKVLEEIANDVVYLQMDLNKAQGGDYVTATKLYTTKKADEGYTMYCYAWNDTNKNAAWPGVAMTEEGDYSTYELKNEFTNVIFNVSKAVTDGYETIWQTVDLTVDLNNPTFTPNASPEEGGKYSGTWGAAPNPEIVPGYYVVGDATAIGSWDPQIGNLMTVDPNDSKHYTLANVALKAQEKIKVCNQNKTVWFSTVTPWTGCGFTVDTVGNIVIEADGTYTIHLYVEGSGGNCISLGLPVSD